MRRLTLAAIASMVWTISAAPVEAAPLTYTEVEDFFDSNGPGQDIGDLDVGVNTISGVVDETDEDHFRFELPDGLAIVGWELTVSGYFSGGGTLSSNPGGYGASDPDGLAGPGGASLVVDGDGSPFASATDVFTTAGLYGVFLRAPVSFEERCDPPPPCQFGCPPPGCRAIIRPGSLTYTLSYTVEDAAQTVPAPAPVSLLAAGLLGVWLRRRSH